MKLFIDDVRSPQNEKGWVLLNDSKSAINLIKSAHDLISEISFGEEDITQSVMSELEKMHREHVLDANKIKLTLHSANSLEQQYFKSAIENIRSIVWNRYIVYLNPSTKELVDYVDASTYKPRFRTANTITEDWFGYCLNDSDTIVFHNGVEIKNEHQEDIQNSQEDTH